MTFLALDLATTGPIKDGQPAPRIVGIAAGIFEMDGKCLGEINILVRPEAGEAIPDEAEKVHGISTRTASRYGVPLRVALPMLTNMAETVPTVVSYGFESDDAQVIRAALASFGSTKPFPRTGAEGVCVREIATHAYGVPGDSGLRWTSIQNAHLNTLSRPLKDMSILSQMRAVAELYRAFKAKGL